MVRANAAARLVGGLTGRNVDFTSAQRAALDRLRETDLTLVALTNSSLEVARDQLTEARLADRFDATLSADEVNALKPRPEPYRRRA